MKNKLITVSISSVLLGCGGGDSDNKQASAPIRLIAYNGSMIVEPGQATKLDMRNYVKGADAIESFTSQNRDCNSVQIDQLSLILDYSSATYCLYDYVAKNQTGETATGSMTVLVTEAKQSSLPSITKNGVVNSVQQFDISALIGEQWQTGYRLDPESILVVVDEQVDQAGKVDVDSSIITYHAGDTAGLQRLVYTVTDTGDESGNTVLMGTIYITLSEEMTSVPLISDTHYTYVDQVLVQQPITVDLSALPGLTITSEGDWQLGSVRSFTGNVAMVDPESTSNTQFTFETADLGDHIVSYTIVDHHGGYATGLIYLNVEQPEKAWSDIGYVVGSKNIIFTAPPTYTEATSLGFEVKPFSDSVGNIAARLTGAQGDLYCKQYGSVPKLSEMNQLYSRVSNVALNSGDFGAWPKDNPYLVKNDSDLSYATFDFATGLVSAANAAEGAYLTCIKSDKLSLEMLNYEVIANGEDAHVASIRKQQDAEVSVTLVNGNGSTPLSNEVTYSLRSVSSVEDILVVSGTAANQIRFQIESNSVTIETPVITLVGDQEGALIDDLQAVRNNTLSGQEDYNDGLFMIANGEDKVTLTVNVKDMNSIALHGALVELQNNQAAHVISDNLIFDYFTDEQGNVSIEFVANESLFSSSVEDVPVTFDVTTRMDADSITFPVKHKNFLARILLEPYEFNKLYLRAKIRVLMAGEPSANTVTLNESVRGSFLHVHGVYDFVQSINVPLDGTDVILSTAYGGQSPQMAFEITGSPFPTELESDHIIDRDTLVLGEFPASASSTEFNEVTIKQYMKDHDSVFIFRTSSGQVNNFYLPDLSEEVGDFIGKTISVQNAAPNNIRVYATPSVYWTLKARTGTACIVRSFYWEGTTWVAFNPATHPEMPQHPTIPTWSTICSNKA